MLIIFASFTGLPANCTPLHSTEYSAEETFSKRQPWIDYLKDLFTRLPTAKITEIGEFTPATWGGAKKQVVAQAA
jgi:hypothetical protein